MSFQFYVSNAEGQTQKGGKPMDQELNWAKHMELGERSFKQNNFSLADEQYNEALKLARKFFPADDIRLAKSYLSCGHLRVFGTGMVYGADRDYTMALEVLEKNQSPESKRLQVDILLELGETYSRQGRSAESLPVLEKALALAQTEHDTKNNKYADILYSLGTSYGVKGQYDKSIKLLRQATEIFEKDQRFSELSSALADLASVLNNAERYSEASAVQRRADEVLRTHR